MAAVPQDQSLHNVQHVIDGVDVGETNPKLCMCAWVGAEVVSPGRWGHPPPVRGGASWSTLMLNKSSHSKQRFY